MARISVGCGQITWNKPSTPGAQSQVSEEQVLAEIAQAGYDGAPAGPKKGRTASDLLALYARYGLRPAPGYIGATFWKPEKQNELLEEARHEARRAQRRFRRDPAAYLAKLEAQLLL